MSKKIRRKLMLIIILSLILCILLGIAFSLYRNKNQLTTYAATYADKVQELVSSNIITENNNSVITNGSSLLQTYIDDYLIENNISSDSLQYCIEDLETHTRYSQNEYENVFAASIYKLPLAMIYYEKINTGEYTSDSLFTYEAFHYEAGGPIGSNCSVGDQIALSKLLHDMILCSDNTAGHILFENLGGWVSFKEAISKYSSIAQEDYFYSYDNVLNASFVSDVLSYLYKHSNDYTQLIADLKNAMPDDYLATSVDAEIAQKYGNYGIYKNAAGIIYGDHPYSIAIFTSLGNQNTVIGDINAICYAYFNGNLVE